MGVLDFWPEVVVLGQTLECSCLHCVHFDLKFVVTIYHYIHAQFFKVFED